MKPRGFEFEEVLTVDPSKSWFDMSYKNKFTANFGKLYPFYVEETMPGDRFKINSTVFARLQPLLAPVMQQCDVFSYFFYVPNRLVWNNWKKFQSNGDGTVKMANAASYVPPAHPYIVPAQQLSLIIANSPKYSLGVAYDGTVYYLTIVDRTTSVPITDFNTFEKELSMFDFFGVPFNYAKISFGDGEILSLCNLTQSSSKNYVVAQKSCIFAPPVGSTITTQSDPSSGSAVKIDGLNTSAFVTDLEKINALPFFAYNKIYNEFFRSQDYQDELIDECVDGQQYDAGNVLVLRSKCFEHDYFTSILPDAQRGPDVTISLSGTATIKNNYPQIPGIVQAATGQGFTGATSGSLGASKGITPSTGPTKLTYDVDGGSSYNVTFDLSQSHKVDLTGVSAVTINALRYANTLQKYEELLARSGSRYNEMLMALYGVESSDASIQRPIFLGASRTPVTINDVAQTSATEGENALAQLAGRGIAVGDVNTDFYCEENGWLIGLCAIVPRTQYFQGLNRHLRKSVNLDYPVPMFAHLGEQEVYKEELYAWGKSSDRNILGYLPRFSEFKYHSDEIHSELKNSLNYWTMARKLSPNALGAVIDADFLRADTMQYDAFADTLDNDDHFILDVTNNVALQRSLPEYSTPQL